MDFAFVFFFFLVGNVCQKWPIPPVTPDLDSKVSSDIACSLTNTVLLCKRMNCTREAMCDVGLRQGGEWGSGQTRTEMQTPALPCFSEAQAPL